MRRNVRAAGAALAAGVLFVGLAACGDDDDDASDDATTEEATEEAAGVTDDGASSEEFCDAAFAVDQANMVSDGSPEATEAADTAMQEALDLAPDEIAEQAEVLVAEAREMAAQPETEDGPPAIPSDEYFTSSAAVGEYLGENCDVEVVEVTATDYAFAGIGESLPAGTALFQIDNQGTEFHEVAVMQIAEGETRTIEELLALPEEEAMSVAMPVGFVFAPPGGGSYVTADLAPGRYAAICFIPVGSTPEAMTSGEMMAEAAPHFAHGMVTEFQVS